MVAAALLFACCGDEQGVDPGSPVISFFPAGQERVARVGDSVVLSAVVDNAARPVFSWKTGGKIVSTERVYAFHAERVGE